MSKEKDEVGKKSTKASKASVKSKSFFTDERIKFVFGILITGFALYLLIACISYLFWWKTDLSLSDAQVLSGPEVGVKNWSGKSGHFLAKLIINFGFGYGAFFIPLIFGSIGLYLLNFPKIKLFKLITKFAFATIILSLILSFIFGKSNGYLGSGPGGAQGYVITRWMNAFLGMTGTGIILTFITVIYLIFALKVKPESFRLRFPSLFNSGKDKETIESDTDASYTPKTDLQDDDNNVLNEKEIKDRIEFSVRNTNINLEPDEPDDELPEPVSTGSIIHDFDKVKDEKPSDGTVPLNITRPHSGENLSDQEVTRIMEDYDPRLDLSRYKFPPISILKEHKSETAFDNTEVFDNKENIIKVLGDHKINIKSISATVGPTVTLYEIVPERGVRLARIKSLEDDIALNLSALGIRIIAPIPGRGTVGIEVPNKKPEMVSMRSLITSKAFQETKFDIALALGRTITNDPYIVDLTKMPHLLVAGATGQGKSVGINAIITSILYKKHPAEVKFVLIDPKRVELPLYMKIERHFLAKLPDEEDAIITDTQKVIKTLNSLCIEMDSRLELLKAAQSRNIKEYNEKFISRKLSPEKGHKYLPYIVLIIDEFADLIMTAGREIEGPIGRLAQLPGL